MKAKTGLQLYSVRKELTVSFDNTLEAISRMGFEFVELAGLHFREPEEVALKLQKHNLKPVSMHCDVLTSEGLKRSLDEAEIMNCEYLVCPWVEPKTFSSEKSISQFAERLNQANMKIRAKGKTLCYHNHDFEFQPIRGESGFDLFVAQLDPEIKLQIDVYNAAIAGINPIKIIETYSDRINMLHIKDGEITPSEPNVAVGSGKMDYSSLFEKIPETTQWIYFEFDSCKSNIFEAIEVSKTYIEELITPQTKT
jgi:sugar phosphate isomerase/epimerase